MRKKIVLFVIFLVALNAASLYAEHVKTCDISLEEEESLALSEAELASFKDLAEQDNVWWKRLPSAVLGHLFIWGMRGYDELEKLIKKVDVRIHGKKKKKSIKA
jgi:hypothetical protein